MSLGKTNAREFTGDPVSGGIDGTFQTGRYDLQIMTSRAQKHPSVRIIPLSDSEASLEVAREADISQRGNRLRVKLPKDKGGVGGDTLMIGGGSTYINGVHYQGPVTIVDGVVYQGQDATVAASSGVRVEVTLPEGSSADIETVSGDAVIDGSVDELRFKSVSGDLVADAAHTVSITTTSGDVELAAVSDGGTVNSVSGDVEIRQYDGRGMFVNTTSGDVRLAAGQQAQGSLDINSVSGNVTTRNTRGNSALRVRSNTVSGRVREN